MGMVAYTCSKASWEWLHVRALQLYGHGRMRVLYGFMGMVAYTCPKASWAWSHARVLRLHGHCCMHVF
eukprot:364310-Chlamydomonas_euryale.AAC.3